MKNPFDLYARDYDIWYDKNKFIFLSELKCIKKALNNRNIKDKKSIEIGVGTGRFARGLNIKYGIDISKNSLKIAKRRRIKVFLSPAEKTPFKDKEFDYVFIIFSLCFFKNFKKALKESVRILKKNGNIIVTMINPDSETGKFYNKKKKKDIFYRNARFYSPRKVIKELEKDNIGNIKTFQTLFKSPEYLKSHKKVEPTKKGHNKGGVVVIKGVKYGN